MSELFIQLLQLAASQSEIESIQTLRAHAHKLSTREFHLLLGRSIRQPELLESRLRQALKDEGLDYFGDKL